jgi:hypothetical protein
LACISRIDYSIYCRPYSINTGTEIEERYSTFRRPYCTYFVVTVQQKGGMEIEGKYSKLKQAVLYGF